MQRTSKKERRQRWSPAGIANDLALQRIPAEIIQNSERYGGPGGRRLGLTSLEDASCQFGSAFGTINQP